MTNTAAPLDLMADRLLPTHPTLCHPHTGQPLRAVGVVAGRVIWPALGASDDDGDGDSGDDGDDSGDDGDDGDDDSGDDGDEDSDDDKKLGPKGERALAAEKEKRRRANEGRQREKKRADDLQAELDRLKGGKGKGKSKDDDDSDDDGDDRRRNAEIEARANAKIVRAEVKSLAADTFISADDAHRYLDVSRYEVDDDGDVVDVDQLKDDLEDVLKKNPHLAKKKRRAQGDGDGGGRGNGKRPDPGPGRARMTAAYGDSKK